MFRAKNTHMYLKIGCFILDKIYFNIPTKKGIINIYLLLRGGIIQIGSFKRLLKQGDSPLGLKGPHMTTRTKIML